MQYTINKTNYHTFEIFGINKMAYRNYFIPFCSEEKLKATDYSVEREKSDKIMFLSGEWNFKYYEKVSQLADVLDTDKVDFEKVNVPSCWTRLGHDQMQYLNSRYVFKADPPKIPTDIPVVVYKKTVEITDVNSVYYITFLGVIAGFDLYVNGSHVGYSEGAHNSHEFDITKYLKEGENEIVAVVFKWSNGSYLECQDMFRENGIFRDVYITKNEQSHIFDYKFEYKKDNDIYKATLKTTVRKGENCKIKATLTYKNEVVAEAVGDAAGTLNFEVQNALEWSTEIPNLYTLYITLIKDDAEIEFVRQFVGFKTIVIDGREFLLNGKGIKFLGVNHHDNNPKTGYVLTAPEMEKDVKLMKEFNVNAVRTSHYPPDPLFLTFCDVYGLYVVDEADIETHGVFEAKGHTENLISNDPKWEKHYLDRVMGMYERDKNHASITMWSLGNESGGIVNHEACNNELKKYTTIPVHYEAACRHPRKRFDVVSMMYPDVDTVRNLKTGKNWDKGFLDAPFFLCEYAHAMGVGPGSLDEYVETFFSDKIYLGGCIWEWADHAVYHESGIKYTYGGNHGELKHDNNFCCDGLFYPDRTPSTSAFCMKNAYKPISARYEDGKLILTNRRFFKDTSDMKIEWSVLAQGKTVKKEELSETITAGAEKVINANLGDSVKKDCFIIVTCFSQKNKNIISEQSVVVNSIIKNEKGREEIAPFKCLDGRFTAYSPKGKIEFSADGEMLYFGLKTVNLLNPKASETKLKGFMPNIYRAAIDNYMYYDKYCKGFGIDCVKNSVRKTFVEKNGSFTVEFALKLRPFVGLSALINYTYYDDGKLEIKCTYKNKSFISLDLPKLGLTFEMPTEYDNIEYYGLGKHENYSDFHAQSVMGIYNEKKSDFYVDYIKPQDNGNRGQARYFSVNNGKNGLLFKAVDTPFNFKVQDVTTKNLSACKHTEDAIHIETSIIHIDGYIRGIGSNSCGPNPRAMYREMLKNKKEFSYSFTVEPITIGK